MMKRAVNRYILSNQFVAGISGGSALKTITTIYVFNLVTLGLCAMSMMVKSGAIIPMQLYQRTF